MILNTFPMAKYFFKVKNNDTRKKSEICSIMLKVKIFHAFYSVSIAETENIIKTKLSMIISQPI